MPIRGEVAMLMARSPEQLMQTHLRGLAGSVQLGSEVSVAVTRLSEGLEKMERANARHVVLLRELLANLDRTRAGSLALSLVASAALEVARVQVLDLIAEMERQ